MISAETVAFLESGCAIIVGSVAPDGEPRADRGWAIDVLPGTDASRLSVRLLIDANEPALPANLAATGRIAITAGNVQTLRSAQLKGRAIAVEPATDEDRARAVRYVEDFANDILAVDRTPRELILRLVPADFVACTVEVDELYDQTPGPGAGAPLERGAP